MQRLVLAVVEKRDFFVGDRREVDLHSARETRVKYIGVTGLRLGELDDLHRSRRPNWR